MEIQKINDNIYYLVFIGSFGGVLLASAVIFFFTRYQRRFLQQQAALQKAELDHKQHLLYATIQSQEKERMRISKDLHDHIGSSLSNLRFVVSRIQNAGADENAVKDLSEECKVNIDRIIEDVRNISHSLSPAGLALWGFHESLKEFCEKTGQSTGLNIQVEDYAEDVLTQLTFDVSLSLFRVMQELLSNTIKHASAKKITITTSKENDAIVIKYADDGNGINANNSNSHGIGLYNIESRLSMIQARYEIISSSGAGYFFNIMLPFHILNKTILYE